MPDRASPDARRRIVGTERTDWTNDYLRRYQAGHSIRTIATDTKRSYGFVHRILTEGNADLRPRGGANHRRTRR